MGKKSREKMRGKGYLTELQEKAEKFMKEVNETGIKVIKDNDGFIYIYPNGRIETEPIEGTNIQEFHRQYLERLDKRHLLGKVSCFISDDKKRIVVIAW